MDDSGVEDSGVVVRQKAFDVVPKGSAPVESAPVEIEDAAPMGRGGAGGGFGDSHLKPEKEEDDAKDAAESSPDRFVTSDIKTFH